MFDASPSSSANRFENSFRPITDLLIHRRWRSHHLAWFATALAAGLAASLWMTGGLALLFGLYPVVLLMRAALWALGDQISAALTKGESRPLAGTKSADLVGDTLLILPFLLVPPFTTAWIVIIIGLVWLIEWTIARRAGSGASACSGGPMTACGRAIVFAMLGTLICMTGTLSPVFYWFQPIMCISLIVTFMRCLRTDETRPI